MSELAIKSMTVSWSNDGEQWDELLQISNIKIHHERQWFQVDSDKAKKAKNMKYIKLNKFTCYGVDSDWNEFSEFGVFGVTNFE